jgi:hypothetical protein
MSRNTIGVWRVLPFLAAAVPALAGCGPREPRTEAERLANGREIVERMSGKLASAQAFTVTTQETREIVKSNGQPQTLALTRKVMVRRPDRMYVETAGDRQNELWYDGVGLTMAMHKEKVFGQARMPETLDRMLDALNERYGIATPVADYAYSSPAKALLTSTTTGGWVARETIDGKPADHLSFKDTGVDWDVWIAASGDPVPVKAIVKFTDTKRIRKVDVTFRDWNLAPQIAADRFTPKVPADYEGIAILQRARVSKNIPEGTEQGVSTVGTVKK